MQKAMSCCQNVATTRTMQWNHICAQGIRDTSGSCRRQSAAPIKRTFDSAKWIKPRFAMNTIQKSSEEPVYRSMPALKITSSLTSIDTFYRKSTATSFSRFLVEIPKVRCKNSAYRTARGRKSRHGSTNLPETFVRRPVTPWDALGSRHVWFCTSITHTSTILRSHGAKPAPLGRAA